MSDNGYFPQAFDYVLRNERGYVNDPDDAGGPTNMGITMESLSDFRGVPVTVDDIQNLTVNEASAIYRQNYWDISYLGQLSQPGISVMVFDSGVLFGPMHAAIAAQRALVTLGYKVTTDGFLGPESQQALDAAKMVSFVPAFTDALNVRIREIIAARPVDEKFRNGWVARINRYNSFV